MVEFRGIKMSLFLMLLLQFTAAATRQSVFSFIGDDVTLSCKNVINDQSNCDRTTWLFIGSRSQASVELIKLGQINEEAKSKSDRLSVAEKCSLVIKKVTVEDVGRYICKQNHKSGRKQGQDPHVYLSVVAMTEQKDTDEVTLNCSVSTLGRCKHTVKWLFYSQEFDKNNQEVMTSQSSCSASVNLQTSHHIYTSRFNFLKCEVTDGYNKKKFLFSIRPSGEKPGDDTKTTTTATESASNDATTVSTTTRTVDTSTELKDLWWLFIIVAVVLAALLIIVVKVIRWRRAKGNKTRINDNVGLTSNPAASHSAAETSQHTTDPEDGVSYASISYTKKTNSKAPVRGKDNGGDAVTYTTVKASSTDPNNLYATIN